MHFHPILNTPSGAPSHRLSPSVIKNILGVSLLAAMLIAAACSSGNSSDSSGDSPRSAPPVTGEIGGPQFSAVIITTDLAVGPNRVVFGLVDREGMPVRPARAQVRAVFLDPQAKTAEVRATSTAHFQEWPVGNQGVFTTQLSLDKPGFWQLNVETTTPDGTSIEARGAFQVKDKPETPAVGQPAPRSVTPTLDLVVDLATITSAEPPDPDLYRLSVDQALDSGKPLVLVFSTPAFCVSATCGPQVEVISQVKEKYQDRANFIHVEVFENPHLIDGDRPVGGTVPAVREWNLPTEPWTFVIDKEGRVRARFEQFTTAQEIEAALLDIL